jgi:hypothetical protein
MAPGAQRRRALRFLLKCDTGPPKGVRHLFLVRAMDTCVPREVATSGQETWAKVQRDPLWLYASMRHRWRRLGGCKVSKASKVGAAPLTLFYHGSCREVALGA